jgi:hypothetical protein
MNWPTSGWSFWDSNGRVIRWSCPGESRGMGATIDEYEFRPTRTQAV